MKLPLKKELSAHHKLCVHWGTSGPTMVGATAHSKLAIYQYKKKVENPSIPYSQHFPFFFSSVCSPVFFAFCCRHNSHIFFTSFSLFHNFPKPIDPFQYFLSVIRYYRPNFHVIYRHGSLLNRFRFGGKV